MIKVLLVDDEALILRLFSAVLENKDFEVSTAASAAEAIARMEEEAFDLVVTDLRMETEMAGFEVVRAGAALTPRPVLVIVTAFPVPPAEWKGAGADALYVKGQSIVSLPEQLRALLKACRRVASTAS